MCGANTEARDWLLSLCELALSWDHVMDGDPVDPARFESAMLMVLLNWPVNAFYQNHKVMLQPVLVNAILAWKSSAMPLSRIKAYDVATEPACAVCYLLHGYSAASQFSQNVRACIEAQIKENN
jgi:hypothetical protein